MYPVSERPTTESTEQRLSHVLNQLADVQLELDAERALRKEVETAFDRTLTSMSDALVETDPRGVVSRVNRSATQLLDPSGEGLIGRPVESLLHPDVPATPWRLLAAAPTGGLAVETWLRRTDGERIAVALSCDPVLDAGGRIAGAIYIARDLTETRRLVSALREAEARWRLLADITSRLGDELEPRAALGDVASRFAEFGGCAVAVVVVPEGHVEDVVLSSQEVPGGEELAGLRGRALPAGTALARVVQSRQPLDAASLSPDFPLFSTTPVTRPAGTAALLPLAAEDRCLGVLAMLADRPRALSDSLIAVGEQVAGRIAAALTTAILGESVAELQSQQEMARFRDDIVAALSHDMKTPLAVITGAVEMIRDMGEDLTPAATRSVFLTVSNQARRLRRLVMQFLDHTRLEAGRDLSVSVRAMHVGHAVEAVVGSFGDRSLFRVDVPPDLPPVLADPDRVDQVLSNLVSNALKFSPAGQVVEISARREGRHVAVTVADQGRGISPKDLANLFQKYYRGYSAEGTEGAGIGLHVSQALMIAQGGRITVTSRLGEGSRFTATFQAAPGHDPERGQGDAAGTDRRPLATQAVHGVRATQAGGSGG